MSAFDRLVDALAEHGVRSNGTAAKARCPAHDDRDPSLSLRRIEGQALVKCHAGCDTRDVVAALGLDMRDLFDDPRGARYQYDDGRIVHRRPDKRFHQSGIDAITAATPQLYRLGKVRAAVATGRPVWLVEGEKDVHALESLGAVATTAPMGGANVGKCDLSPLHGAEVLAVLDQDDTGQRWAQTVRERLAGRADSLAFYAPKAGHDAADHIAADYTLEQFVFLELADRALPADVDDVVAFWNARPILRHVHDFARARRVAPWAMLGHVLARVCTVVPPFVVLPPLVGSTASLNLYVALVGTSGAGKDVAGDAAAEAIDVGDLDTAGVGSGEGIAHQFATYRGPKDGKPGGVEQYRERLLLTAAEVDTLTALHRRQASTLLAELRKAWTGSALGFSYVDPTKRIAVGRHRYRLCLVVGVQPARAGGILDDADAGTPQRFVWLPATDPDAPGPDHPPADVEPLTDWRLPAWPTIDTPGRKVVLRVCQTAREMIDTARVARLRGDGEALDGHGLLCRLKVAALLAILDGRADVVGDDWTLAGVVAARSDRTRAGVVQTLQRAQREANVARGRAEGERSVIVAEHLEDAAVRRVAVLVRRKLGREWIAHSVLRNKIAKRDRIHFDAAVARLADAGQIEAGETDRGTAYRLPEEAS